MNVLHVVRPVIDLDAVASITHAHPIERGAAEPEVVSRIVRGFYPDQLRAAFGFGDIEHRLLDSGEFEAQFLHVAMAKLSLHLFHYSRPVALCGACPAGRVALIFRIGMTDRQMPHDHTFPTGGIAMFGSSVEIEVRLPPRAKFALLTLDRQHLEGVLESLDDPDRTECTPSGVPSATRELEGRRLTGLLRAVIDDADLTCTFLNSRECFAVFERDIVNAFGRAWSTAETNRGNGSSALERRGRLVKKAEQYVIAHLDESIRMDRLCREVGASARALEYAFHDVYGMGAMRYLRLVRLNEVRKALLESGGSNPTTVTAAAMDWGFWHLGEFAAAYRQLFGEAPSATLRTAAAESVRFAPAI